MKKLYLIGDSIRMGYAPYVRAALKGKAEVYWPDENCRFAAYTYYALGDWEANLRVGEDCNVVHWNVGLHDVIHFTGDDAVSTPEIYAFYLERIIHRLEFLYPKATQIFANTTPIIEEKHNFWLNRKNADVDGINEVAEAIMKKNGIQLNDLHSIITPECFCDKCHFNNPVGRETTVKAVLKAVCPALGIDCDSLEMPDFSDEAISELDKAELLA